ncbi:MAG: hypothetical protein WC882_03965 [Candidatus Gracilibacteria bacterium]
MKTLHSSKIVLTSFLLGTILCLNFLTGCKKTQDFYAGPIPGWEDIAVPENAILTQSSANSPVENHFFTLDSMTRGELFAFLEDAMVVNGWELNASAESRRQFIKNENVATYDCSMSEGTTENPLSFLVIIEPSGIYGTTEEPASN